jgi:hypothetical protein
MNSVLQSAMVRVQPNQYFKHLHFTPFRSILAGAGFCYAIEEDKFWHLPVTFLFPSMYAGYQGYKNREQILNFMKKTL